MVMLPQVPLPLNPGYGPRLLIAFVGQHRKRGKLDTFLVQFLGLLGRGNTVDRPVVGFAIVHLAGLLGKSRADILGIADKVVAQILKLAAELLLLRRDHGNGCRRPRRGGSRRHGPRSNRRGRSRRCRKGRLCLRSRRVGARKARRHQGLFHLGAAAEGAGDEAALRLLVISGRVRKPAFEFVPLVADQGIADHQTTRRCAGSARGSMISKRRPCWSEGIRERAAATAAGSISAITTPGSMSPSARMRPHGSMTIECPKVSRPTSWRPPCAAASTKQPFSMAPARLRLCQCASPVCLVKQDGMARNTLPASASARWSAGKRKS